MHSARAGHVQVIYTSTHDFKPTLQTFCHTHGVPSGGLAPASRPAGTTARHREFGCFLDVLACNGKSAIQSNFGLWHLKDEEILHSLISLSYHQPQNLTRVCQLFKKCFLPINMWGAEKSPVLGYLFSHFVRFLRKC